MLKLIYFIPLLCIAIVIYFQYSKEKITFTLGHLGKKKKNKELTSTPEVTANNNVMFEVQAEQYRKQQKQAFILLMTTIILAFAYAFFIIFDFTYLDNIGIEKLDKVIGMVGGIGLSGGAYVLYNQASRNYNSIKKD